MDKKIDRRNFVKLSTGGNSYGNDSTSTVSREETIAARPAGDKTLRLGFIGIGGRGSYHLNAALGIEGIEVPAICELKPVRLYQAKRWIEAAGLPAPRLYDRGPEDFKRLCESEDLDAVICCTPWEYHTPVCVVSNEKQQACGYGSSYLHNP